jgi:type II secretory pathway pseudopilin PulG
MPKLSKKSTSGFSLVEVLVTIAFILIILSVCLTLTSTLRSIRHIQWETLAYNVAKNKMEELRSTPFSSLPVSGSFGDPQLSRLPSGSGLLEISGSNLKNIKVIVSWVQESKTKNYTLETYFTGR